MPTRQRVLQVIAATGFVRNSAVHQLRTGRSLTVGMIVFDIANPFYAEIVRGAQRVLLDAGYALAVCSSDKSFDREARYLRALEERDVDGILITPVLGEPGPGEMSALATLAVRGVPTVLLGRDGSALGLCSVAMDDIRGGELVASHLLERGHQVLGLVNGPASIRQCADIRRGARRAFRPRTPDGLVELTAPALSIEHGEKAVAQLLASKPLPTAVMCVNDLLALGVLGGLADAGIRVPADVAVIGYEDVPGSSIASPPLSSVRYPTQEMGALAATLLLEEAGQRAHEHRCIRLEPQIVLRASSA